MGRETVHSEMTNAYLKYMAVRDLLAPAVDDDDEDEDSDAEGDLQAKEAQLRLDLAILEAIKSIRYLRGRQPVPKAGNLNLAWVYAENEEDHGRFQGMLRVSPLVFSVILELIKDNPVFANNSHVPQTPVDIQLAVTLYRLGHYGNAASLEDVARLAGISEGSVETFTYRCFDAIEALHDMFVRPLTQDEKEREKEWMDEHLGFKGLWREGWIMYDGTIVVLYSKPGLNGDAYYTRKANYGLNVQIGNTPSNLRICDYCHGFTGSAHDAAAFEHTAAVLTPEWLFEGNEFAWGDSAYTLNARTIPVHRRPASLIPENAVFDKVVSHLRVRSEHCIGALKGRWQCLRDLRVNINSIADHERACRWITVPIILHNLIIDVEGEVEVRKFEGLHGIDEEQQDRGGRDEPIAPEYTDDEGEKKRIRLTAELLAHRGVV